MENLCVVVRLKENLALNSFIHLIDSKTLSLSGITNYVFDFIFDSSSDNSLIFEFLTNVLNQSFKGINCTIFAYGEQGSGKTFTMFGDNKNLGIILLTVSYLFKNNYHENFCFSCSMAGISSDSLVDLLKENSTAELKIKKDANNSVIVENLAEIIVEKEEDCFFLIKRGLQIKKKLKLACDVVFQINIESLKADKKGFLLCSKINFCDLLCDKASKNFRSLNSVLTCLSNNVTVSYKDSNLTKFLADTLNKTSNSVMIATVLSNSNLTLETLTTGTLVKKIIINPKKNEYLANNFQVLKKLHTDISKLKNILRHKQGGGTLHDEVLLLKKETERLKENLNEQTTLEDLEKLIRKNKNLKIYLQNLMERPLADHDIELPDSISLLQKALVATEDLIKKKKVSLIDQELKAKLLADGRCTICTLKLPCKHNNSALSSLYNFSEQNSTESRKIYSNLNSRNNSTKTRIKTGKIKSFISKTPIPDRKFIDNTEKKIKLLTKIESYREKKVLQEIEKAEIEKKIEEEEKEKKKFHELKRKKYLENNKKKLEIYKLQKQKILELKEKPKKVLKKRVFSNLKISNFHERKRSISELLKQHSKNFHVFNSRRTKSISQVEDSVVSLQI